MKSTIIALALSGAALAVPQSSPGGCQDTVSGTFQVSPVNVTKSAQSLDKRQSGGALVLTLNKGILKDSKQRTGYIASNRQYQFDSPPQAGAVFTDGFCLYANNSLGRGGSAIWWQCLSGEFYNIYDKSQGGQCNQIFQVAQKDGASPSVTQISDGQPQAPTGKPISQISDGQPQVPTGKPVITQISDGQPQAPTGKPVITQISDGQPQAPTGVRPPVITQISDGQPQAPTGRPSATRASNATTRVTPPPALFTGAADAPAYGFGALALGVIGGIAALL